MPKINVYLPDDLAEAVKESGVPVSAICQRALEQAVRRVTAIRAAVLGELDDDLAARLPHFTPRVRTAIKLAVERARAAGAGTVSSGHLLAGLLAEGTNLALHVLRALEIEPDRVGADLARHRAAETSPPPAATETETSSQRFSLPAANALELAVTEATSFGHNYVGGEHLLLGLIAEPEGAAGQVLRTLGAEPRLTRRAVAAALAGYVHLRAQTAAGVPGTAAVPGAAAIPGAAATPAAALANAIRQELAPLIRRIERLEERTGATTSGD